MLVRKSALADWLDSECNQAFIKALESELERVYNLSANTFVSGNPNLTHEQKAMLVGQEHVLRDLLEFFKHKDYESFFGSDSGVEVIEDSEE